MTKLHPILSRIKPHLRTISSQIHVDRRAESQSFADKKWDPSAPHKMHVPTPQQLTTTGAQTLQNKIQNSPSLALFCISPCSRRTTKPPLPIPPSFVIRHSSFPPFPFRAFRFFRGEIRCPQTQYYPSFATTNHQRALVLPPKPSDKRRNKNEFCNRKSTFTGDAKRPPAPNIQQPAFPESLPAAAGLLTIYGENTDAGGWRSGHQSPTKDRFHRSSNVRRMSYL
jgi:hypothetical protein